VHDHTALQSHSSLQGRNRLQQTINVTFALSAQPHVALQAENAMPRAMPTWHSAVCGTLQAFEYDWRPDQPLINLASEQQGLRLTQYNPNLAP